MTPKDIISLFDAICICGEQHLDRNVKHAFAADLMSDVLRLNTEDLLLITGMANLQVIRTAGNVGYSFYPFREEAKMSLLKWKNWPKRTGSCCYNVNKVCSKFVGNYIKQVCHLYIDKEGT